MTFTHSDSFLSCDWGTSTFRLNLVEKATGQILASYVSSDGMKILHQEWTKRAKHSKPEFYLNFLNRKIKSLAEQTTKNLNHTPILISGMASSSIGFEELRYQTIPLNLEKPDLTHKVISGTTAFRHDIILVSGLCSSNDIMRGEETQLLGTVKANNIRNGCCIFPGTHSKHLFIENRQLTNFKTYLTGELFDLIANQSILKNSVSGSEKPLSKKSFRQGIQTARNENLLHNLFAIRANNLLHNTAPENNYDFLSGLLIGTELKELTSLTNEQIIIVAANPLRSYYSAGLDYLEIDYTVSSTPADLTIRGHRWILSNLTP